MLSPPSSPGLGKVIVLPPTSPGGSAILCFFFILAHNSIERKKLKVAQSCPTLCNPMDNRVHGILQARILEWVTVPFSRGSSQPRSSALQVDSLPAEPPGKPKNTGAGSLSLLQRIFPTQESNQGLLNYRQILYQLSYQRSPANGRAVDKSEITRR